MTSPNEKQPPHVDEIMSRSETNDFDRVGKVTALESHEVFKKDIDGVEFRTLSWQRAAILFTKICFAMSILSTPAAFADLGAVGGSLSVWGWTGLNTYGAVVMGDFRNRHPECHSLADMMGHLWGRFGHAVVVFCLVTAQILVSSAGIVSTSTAFNALSNHGACTVIWAFLAAALITLISSIRTCSRLGWLTWFGTFTFIASVFIFTVAVSQQDRPAAAPPTGDYDLGFVAINHPTFITGMLATMNLFVFSCGAPMYMPIISEMRKPQEYRKAAITAGIATAVLYFVFSILIYRYCGTWLSVPAFGSAGELWKKVSYGVAVPGLLIGVGLYQHVAAKYVFVQILRNSKHLQSNTFVHWFTWIGTNLALGAAAFIVAEAVPVLNFLLGLSASLFFANFTLTFPMLLWMHDFKNHRKGSSGQKAQYAFHVFILLLGIYLVVAGNYSTAIAIRDAFASGFIAKTFDCSDNSGFAKQS